MRVHSAERKKRRKSFVRPISSSWSSAFHVATTDRSFHTKLKVEMAIDSKQRETALCYTTDTAHTLEITLAICLASTMCHVRSVTSYYWQDREREREVRVIHERNIESMGRTIRFVEHESQISVNENAIHSFSFPLFLYFFLFLSTRQLLPRQHIKITREYKIPTYSVT